ncbi:MAG: hypothetical protein HUU35_12595 [Armatimonadetes bacterium]|nr:hypothetical protein [Armatimonadota bacterium]
MDRDEVIVWSVSGGLMAIWFVGFFLNAGLWIHAFLIASCLLGVFDLLAQRQARAPRKKRSQRKPPAR